MTGGRIEILKITLSKNDKYLLKIITFISRSQWPRVLRFLAVDKNE
jgi:hypothetical protein